jgi:hypothetical protein
MHPTNPIFFCLLEEAVGFLGFFWFPVCSHQVCKCSQHVSQVLNVFPNVFPIAPHFVPYALPNIVLLEPIKLG